MNFDPTGLERQAQPGGKQDMHLRYFLAASAASLTIACALATPALAQETTSTIRGTVTSGGTAVRQTGWCRGQRG